MEQSERSDDQGKAIDQFFKSVGRVSPLMPECPLPPAFVMGAIGAAGPELGEKWISELVDWAGWFYKAGVDWSFDQIRAKVAKIKKEKGLS